MDLLNEFERRWILYARKVLAQNSGCPCDVDEISWPGYIGKNYASGRVLIVGAIHNAPVLRASGIYDIVPSVKRWRSSPSSNAGDRAYLDMVSAAYESAIPNWKRYHNQNGTWVNGTVWLGISSVVEALGLTFGDIAFTNLAKCGLPSGTSWSIEKPRMRAHDAATPIASLIGELEPAYVLIAKDTAELQKVVGLNALPNIVRQCHNLNFTSKGIQRSEWLPADVKIYRATMKYRSGKTNGAYVSRKQAHAAGDRDAKNGQ